MEKPFQDLVDEEDKTTLSVDAKGSLKEDRKIWNTNEIGKAVKKEQWNTYRITAKDFTFTHYINGVKTTELIDNDKKAGEPVVFGFRSRGHR